MSSRHFRKKIGDNSLPPPEDDSDREYEPLYSQRPAQSSYAGLMPSSSQSESEQCSPEPSEGEQDCAAALPTGYKKKKNKKQDKGKAKGKICKAPDELDEIDRSVKEVNALLGEPVPAPEKKKDNWAVSLLRVEPKHLNLANELRRLLGPDKTETNRRRVQPNRALLLKRILIQPNKNTKMYEFNNYGLSMVKDKVVNDRIYFVFIHDENYRKMHREFLVRHGIAKGTDILTYVDYARKNMHVEALLEISDLLFKMEENSAANEIIENIVTFLQYVSDPQFILSNANVRMEYKIMENRPFFVSLLKYAYLLSNKACHRTALEVIKLMLILDPTDPLGLLTILDALALRAREHEWFIDMMKYFDKQRDALLLFNTSHSYALAHYHVAIKNNEDLTEANKLMKKAIMAHPEVLVKILECAKVPKPDITTHKIFQKMPERLGTKGLDELFLIYAQLTWPRWREPGVLDWVLRNAAELCESFNTNRKVQEELDISIMVRRNLFETWPKENLRHIAIISSMSKLILDAPLTSFNRPTCGWNPLFERGINRYHYVHSQAPPPNVGPTQYSAFYRFFQSMLPSTNFNPPSDD